MIKEGISDMLAFAQECRKEMHKVKLMIKKNRKNQNKVSNSDGGCTV